MLELDLPPSAVAVSGGTAISEAYDAYLEGKAARLAHADRTERNRQNFLRRELEWLRRQPKARATKQKARIGRAQQAIGQSAPKLDGILLALHGAMVVESYPSGDAELTKRVREAMGPDAVAILLGARPLLK